MKENIQMRLNWKTVAQYPSAQIGLISNMITQRNKTKLSVELFFQVLFVKSKINGAGVTPVFV